VDAVLLSRIQFGLTAGFHFIFPPLTIGLAWFLVWMMWKVWKTGEESYRRMARFWLRLFAISFAVGVATGITLEFQFGTNWAEYSRFVGDIFGAPLAAEGILAFFLESTFMGVLLFGWKRLSEKTLWISSLMVAIGSTLSGFWIIAANSWQQTPAGFHIVGGRAELTNFWEAVFNPSTVPRYLHTIDGALITGAFFVLGISAWYLLNNRDLEFARRSMKMALVVGVIASLLQLGIGHYHAVQVAETQPEKLAAVEGLFETQSRAPALVFGIPDADAGKMRSEIKLPGLLSLLAFGSLDAEVKGLNDFPRDEWPPLGLTFYPFHLMVALGMFFIAFTLLGLFLHWRRILDHSRWFLRIALLAIPLPFIANELGWISAEVGRQPWAVYRVLKTQDAVSATVPASQVLLSIIAFCLIYSLLFGVWIYLLRREIRKGPDPAGDMRGQEVAA
jgi:cytochrome d ubiquinol oxidase subunit I